MDTPAEAPAARPRLSPWPGPLVLGLAALGLIMVLHGTGIAPAGWLNPDPRTPAWVFSLTGLFLLLGALLAAGRLVRLPPRLIAVTGWSSVAIAVVMMNWLVFFATGGSCGAGSGSLVVEGEMGLCRGALGVLTGLLDLVLVVVLAPLLCRRGVRRRTD